MKNITAKLDPVIINRRNDGRYIITESGHLDICIDADRTAEEEVVYRIGLAQQLIADNQRELDFLNQLQRELRA